MIKEIYLWNFVGAVYYSVKNLWVHAPAAPVLTQALNVELEAAFPFGIYTFEKKIHYGTYFITFRISETTTSQRYTL